MELFTLGNKDKSHVIFQSDQNTIWLRQLFGMYCGSCGDNPHPRRMAGPVILSTSLGRCDGNRLKINTMDFQQDEAVLTWTAYNNVLRLESRWVLSSSTGVLSRKDRLTNLGEKNISVYRCLPRFTLSPGYYEVYAQQSRWSNENQGAWIPLHAGRLTFCSEWGRNTEGGTPYACLREIGGERGLAFHVIPNGNWVIHISAHPISNQWPHAVIELGLSDEDLHYNLAPQQTFDLPEILVQELPKGEPHRAAPYLHQYINARLPAETKPQIPVIYNTWFDQFHTLDVPRLLDQVKAVREIGCEAFVVDAGWFGPGDNDWGQVGDWREKTECAFYGKMKEFADEVRAAGLGFGIWMEPERDAQNIPVRQKHPEWFVPEESRIRMEDKNARDYVYGEISRLIETYQLAWMKIDFNASLGQDETGAELYDYFAAWYGVLDAVRRKYPQTVIENCSSGAMRTDLSSMFHYDVHFPSDTVNPMDVLRISQGAFLRMLPGRIGRWATLRGIGSVIPDHHIRPHQSQPRVVTPCGATWNIAETVGIDYLMCAAMTGMLGFSGDLITVPPEYRRRIRWYVDFHKKWCRLLLNSAGHMLTPPQLMINHAGWIAFQMQDPDTTTSIVFWYHRPDDGRFRRRFQLNWLRPEATYLVSKEGPDGSEESSAAGRELMIDGLEIVDPCMQHAKMQSGIMVIKPK